MQTSMYITIFPSSFVGYDFLNSKISFIFGSLGMAKHLYAFFNANRKCWWEAAHGIEITSNFAMTLQNDVSDEVFRQTKFTVVLEQCSNILHASQGILCSASIHFSVARSAHIPMGRQAELHVKGTSLFTFDFLYPVFSSTLLAKRKIINWVPSQFFRSECIEGSF